MCLSTDTSLSLLTLAMCQPSGHFVYFEPLKQLLWFLVFLIFYIYLFLFFCVIILWVYYWVGVISQRRQYMTSLHIKCNVFIFVFSFTQQHKNNLLYWLSFVVAGLFDCQRYATDLSIAFCQVWKPSWALWSSQWRKWWTSWFWPSLLLLFLPSLAFNFLWEICVRNVCDGPLTQMKQHLNSLTPPPHLMTLCSSTTPWVSTIQHIPTVPSISLNILRTQVCLTH